MKPPSLKMTKLYSKNKIIYLVKCRIRQKLRITAAPLAPKPPAGVGVPPPVGLADAGAEAIRAGWVRAVRISMSRITQLGVTIRPPAEVFIPGRTSMRKKYICPDTIP